MDATRRIIVNTAVQYAKSLINIGLSLYSTRLILDALTISDYGIYSVVGGFVAMLGFIVNALVVTTQRYISYHQGNEDYEYIRKLFVNSLFLHILIGIVVSVTLWLPKAWLMESVLNIDHARLSVARSVYDITILMLFMTIITAPFKALFIARENIVYISVVEICDGILKLLLAIMLIYIAADKLLVYAYMMFSILLVNFLAFVIYAKLHFTECSLLIRRCDIKKEFLTRLMGFAGWTTFGMGAVSARNQGTAVVLNHFFGTVINAAYGIAFQVQSAVAFVATSILNAMNPQIMKAEGAYEREKAVMLAKRESKYSTSLLAIVAIPLIVEMPSVLAFWLKEVPEGTVFFCRCILIAFLFDQLTYGLHSLNQASGHIKKYTLLIYTPKLLTLPLVYLIIYIGYGVEVAMYVYIIIELLMSLIRLPYLKYTMGLSIVDYMKTVIVPALLLCVMVAVVGWLCNEYGVGMFMVNILIMLLSGVLGSFLFVLNKEERTYAISLIRRRGRI